jgi:hypothetical protein
MSHCYKLSPFQAHWRRWHCTNFLNPACLFIVHLGSGPSPLSCGVFLPPPLLQAFPLLIAGHVLHSCLFQLACLFTAHMGSGLPPSPVEFSSHCHFYKLSHSWVLGMWCCSCLLLPCLFFYSSVRDSPPPPLALRVPCPLCYVSFMLLLLIIQFLFYPWLGLSLSKGLC